MPDDVFVIAEAGVNHNGSLDLALRLVDVAAESGADAVKFQTFSAARLAGRDAGLAEYQKRTTEGSTSQYEMLRALELDHAEFSRIRQHCDDAGIMFLSTGFDLDELEFLIRELRIPMVKIASGDLTFAPMLVAAGASGLPTILSTGMANLDEVGHALRFIAAGHRIADGLLDPDERITEAVLTQAWDERDERRDFSADVTVLHCTSEYPAPLEQLNLRAMTTIAQTFGTQVGYSDHSLGSLASTVAVTLGAIMIEKHFTLDPALPGPDHAASLDPAGLRDFVSQLRSVGVALGSSKKVAQPVELGTRAVVRRSLVASRAIRAGEIVTAADLECRRPAAGRSAFEFWDVVGAPALRDYAVGEYVD